MTFEPAATDAAIPSHLWDNGREGEGKGGSEAVREGVREKAREGVRG